MKAEHVKEVLGQHSLEHRYDEDSYKYVGYDHQEEHITVWERITILFRIIKWKQVKRILNWIYAVLLIGFFLYCIIDLLINSHL